MTVEVIGNKFSGLKKMGTWLMEGWDIKGQDFTNVRETGLLCLKYYNTFLTSKILFEPG